MIILLKCSLIIHEFYIYTYTVTTQLLLIHHMVVCKKVWQYMSCMLQTKGLSVLWTSQRLQLSKHNKREGLIEIWAKNRSSIHFVLGPMTERWETEIQVTFITRKASALLGDLEPLRNVKIQRTFFRFQVSWKEVFDCPLVANSGSAVWMFLPSPILCT